MPSFEALAREKRALANGKWQMAKFCDPHIDRSSAPDAHRQRPHLCNLVATLPYRKLAHGIARTAALLRHAIEKRLPNPVGLGAD